MEEEELEPVFTMVKRKKRYVMLVVPLSIIRQFVVYDFIGGSAIYWLMLKVHFPLYSAFFGSMVAPIAMKRAVSSGTRLRRMKVVPLRQAVTVRHAGPSGADAAKGSKGRRR